MLCVSNESYEASLERRKVYATLPDSDAAIHDQLRVIDESGEDYLFPSTLFTGIVLKGKALRAVLAAV